MILTANAEATKWTTNIKPLRAVLFESYGEEEGTRMLNLLLKDLPFQLPRTRPNIDLLLEIKTGEIFQNKPREVNRIGVGYKDKGSLAGTGKIEVPDLKDFVERQDVFDSLFRQVHAEFNVALIKKR